MKAVLLSIQPKWCELIASGKKTIEVRKTRPKLETPFKCYIYCTKLFYRKGDGYFQGKYYGKVIGEFVCRGITIFEERNGAYFIPDFILNDTCLTDKELWQYGQGKELDFWDISDLVIYDKPKELSEFWQKGGMFNSKYYNIDDLKVIGVEVYKPITRPPQSWCYVEDLKGGVQE